MKCIFIGYSDESKGYSLYNPYSRELVISNDVIFYENGAWKWNNEELLEPPLFKAAET